MCHTQFYRMLTASAMLMLALLGGCADQPFRPSPSALPASPQSATPSSTYRVLTRPWSTYDEIYAGSQEPEPDDAVRIRCPEERPVRGRVWKITLLAGQLPGSNRSDYMAHFNFDGDKYFIAYVGRADNGDPLADYRFYESAYSTDNRYRAEPYGRLTRMCHGRYTRFPGGRVWAGNYTVVAHEGEITFGPAYTPYTGDGSGGCADHYYTTGIGADTSAASPSMYDASYDPYNPIEPACGGASGSPGIGDEEGEGETFASQCSAMEGKLYYDYVCLEVWNEDTGRYETLWCGVAAICET